MSKEPNNQKRQQQEKSKCRKVKSSTFELDYRVDQFPMIYSSNLIKNYFSGDIDAWYQFIPFVDRSGAV